MGNDKIHRVQSSKCVGNHHTDYLSKKISRAIGGLKQVRRFVSSHALFAIHKALKQPLFDNFDVVWSGLNEGLTNHTQNCRIESPYHNSNLL